MGDTRCAAGCKMGVIDGHGCAACGGTGVAHHGMPASQPKPEAGRELMRGCQHYFEAVNNVPTCRYCNGIREATPEERVAPERIKHNNVPRRDS